jgi:hypothetical protein
VLFVCLFDPSVGVTASLFGLGATLSNFFGQMVVEKFDHVTSLMVSFAISHGVMASNILWGHIGSVASAVLAGVLSYVMYPQSKFCFLVIGASALLACFFIQYLPEGDPHMGRGFVGKVAVDDHGLIQPLKSDEESNVEVALTKKTDDDIVEPNRTFLNRIALYGPNRDASGSLFEPNHTFFKPNRTF